MADEQFASLIARIDALEAKIEEGHRAIASKYLREQTRIMSDLRFLAWVTAGRPERIPTGDDPTLGAFQDGTYPACP
jgi:hypothetical protein